MSRVRVGDGTAYEVHVAGAGQPLLLIHGFTGRAASWRPHRDALGRHRRTIVVDLLGHGRSDAPTDPARHAVERQAADLVEILGTLDAHPADILGYSFGARIALRIAIDHPGAVARLVLESPSAGIEEPAARAARHAADERWIALLEQGDLAAFADRWEAQPMFASRRGLPRDAAARARRIQLANDPTALAASLRGAGQGVMAPLHDRLHEIPAPTLVLAGRLDPTGVERATVVASAIPGARLEVLPDAGHAPHLEAPEAFRRLVVAFLATTVREPVVPSPALVT